MWANWGYRINSTYISLIKIVFNLHTCVCSVHFFLDDKCKKKNNVTVSSCDECVKMDGVSYFHCVL